MTAEAAENTYFTRTLISDRHTTMPSFAWSALASIYSVWTKASDSPTLDIVNICERDILGQQKVHGHFFQI
jgi:hypothetical protein